MSPRSVGSADSASVAGPVQIPQPIERSVRTSEIVAASIRSQVARGELKPGDRFPAEDELMEVFGIARNTLREALRILESEGLVTVLRGRNGGPRVTSPTVDHIARMFGLLLQIDGVDIGDVYTARTVIEPRLAGMLAATRTPQALAELKQAIDAAAAAALADDGTAFGEAAAAVHEKITEHAGNASLKIFVQLLHEIVAKGYRWSGRAATSEDRKRAVRSYRKLYKLIEAGDAEGAEAHWAAQMANAVRPKHKEPLKLYS